MVVLADGKDNWADCTECEEDTFCGDDTVFEHNSRGVVVCEGWLEAQDKSGVGYSRFSVPEREDRIDDCPDRELEAVVCCRFSNNNLKDVRRLASWSNSEHSVAATDWENKHAANDRRNSLCLVFCERARTITINKGQLVVLGTLHLFNRFCDFPLPKKWSVDAVRRRSRHSCKKKTNS